NKCLETLLSEDQTLFYLKLAFEKIQQNNYKAKHLEPIKKIFTNNEFLNTNCPVKTYIAYIDEIIEYVIFTKNTNKFTELKNTVQKKADELILNAQSLATQNQQQL